jgi:hypothetical protein
VPLVIETMTFGHADPADLEKRYAAESAALAGHSRIVWCFTGIGRGSAAPNWRGLEVAETAGANRQA